MDNGGRDLGTAAVTTASSTRSRSPNGGRRKSGRNDRLVTDSQEDDMTAPTWFANAMANKEQGAVCSRSGPKN